MPHFIFMLIMSIAGQPERIAALCDTYQQCSDVGRDVQLRYVAMFNRAPSDVSYRIVEVIQ